MEPTLLEKTLKRAPTPYAITSVLLVSAIVAANSLSLYLDTHDVQAALWYLSGSWADLVNIIANLILPIYALLSIRYMRDKVNQSRKSLAELSPDGEKTLNKVFKASTSPAPAILIAILLGIPTIINENYRYNIKGPTTMIVWPIALALVLLVYGYFIWTYISVVNGLYRLGRHPLRLKPYYIDKTLGLKPLGYISLNTSLVYFTGLFLSILQIFTTPLLLTTTVEVAILIGLGVALFFLPLYSAHLQLVQARNHYDEELKTKLNTIYQSIMDEQGSPSLDPSKASHLIAYDTIERKITAIPSWPVDIGMIRTLTALIASLSSALVGRLILKAIGL